MRTHGLANPMTYAIIPDVGDAQTGVVSTRSQNGTEKHDGQRWPL